jgi:micrococcal nuclease
MSKPVSDNCNSGVTRGFRSIFRQHLVILAALLAISPIGCTESSTDNLPESGHVFTGKVVHIVDGDTFDILTPFNQQVRVRLEGIDAPERGMDFYKVSKLRLGELCSDEEVRLEVNGKDRYKRVIGRPFLDDGTDICLIMVEEGMAWHFLKYSDEKALHEAEQRAREQRAGIWSLPDPTPPWEHRKKGKN